MIQVALQGETMLIRGETMHTRLILDCGQAFRFEQQQDGSYFGVAGDRAVFMRDDAQGLCLYPVRTREEQAFWANYLDLQTDYCGILRRLTAEDAVLAAAVREFAGIRLLNQQPFETLISFILSANNNILRIKGIIERLCALAGEQKQLAGRAYYAFPTAERIAALNEAQLRAQGAGYRAPYLLRTARRICEGFDPEGLRELDYAEAKKALCTLPGVGPKVADCVLLFALGKKEAFPADTWIRKVLTRLYGEECSSEERIEAFARRHFGAYGGIAQQYLFHYGRMHKLI